MQLQSAHLTFDTSAFAISAGEDDATNPGIYGKALAEWLAEQLRASGFAAGDVFAEDFGWCIPVPAKPYTLYVACMMTDDEPNECTVFAFAEGGLLSRLFGRDERPRHLNPLHEAVTKAVEAAPFVDKLVITP
jgi:hypothetical protein